LPSRWAKQKGLSPEVAANTLHPIQEAWIAEQTPLCGFCQNGMMIKATELLEHNASPSVAQIKEAFTSGVSPHLCRCGSYTAIIEAVQRASSAMTKRSEA
jgi:isoquinoline 1-oxidoreductase alpha subunit